MNKRGEKYGLMVLAVVAVVAVIGLVTYFGNGTLTGAAPYFTSWDGTYKTAGEAAIEEGYPGPEELAIVTKLCTEDIMKWASTREGTKAGQDASKECGKCCVAAAEAGKISKYDIDVCSRVCSDRITKSLFRLA